MALNCSRTTDLTVPQQMREAVHKPREPLVRHAPDLLVNVVEVYEQELSVTF